MGKTPRLPPLEWGGDGSALPDSENGEGNYEADEDVFGAL